MVDNVYYLPAIAPHDYQFFRDMMEDKLPRFHQEWVKSMNKRRLEQERLHKSTVRFIELNLDEFTRYLRTGGQRANQATLHGFIVGKAHGSRY
jgi:hypothetical protein